MDVLNDKLHKINNTLKKVYGVELNFNVDPEELKRIYEYYNNLKMKILQEETYNSYFTSKEYTKAMLVMEAVKIFLSEISPRRRKQKE